MRKETIATLALAGVLILVVDGSPENRGVIEALKKVGAERADCERQVGRNLRRLVMDRYADLEVSELEYDLIGSDSFFNEAHVRLNERAGVSFIIHRACAVAHRTPRLPAHDKCSRMRKRVGC